MDFAGYLYSNSFWSYDLLMSGRSCSVHSINKKRKELGEFHHLYFDVRKDPIKFRQYLRINIETFDYILCNVKSKLWKKMTNFIQNPISPEEKLVVTLRFLAVGTSFRTLVFSFRMGKSTVAAIVFKFKAIEFHIFSVYLQLLYNF